MGWCKLNLLSIFLIKLNWTFFIFGILALKNSKQNWRHNTIRWISNDFSPELIWFCHTKDVANLGNVYRKNILLVAGSNTFHVTTGFSFSVLKVRCTGRPLNSPVLAFCKQLCRPLTLRFQSWSIDKKTEQAVLSPFVFIQKING